MKLEKLIIENFRQFRGRQEILFSTLDDKNVTLVHAENGFGKTALLNALLWGFYGHEGLTADLAIKESIIHEGFAARAKDPARAAATVTILFHHEDAKYTLTRTLGLEQQQLDHKKTDLTLEVQRNDGQTFTERVPQQKIQALMPSGISNLLFFNGERIDHLAMEENASQITDAIRQMLGLTLIQAAIEDLQHQNVRGKIRSELRDRASDEKAAKIDEQASVDDQIVECAKRKETTQKNLSATDVELDTINAKLKANQEAHQLQAKRQLLEKQRDGLNERLQTVTKHLTQLVADDGYALFADDLVNRGREIVAKLRSEGKIPARVLNSFLHELLDKHHCICTRHLDDGSAERKAVEELMTFAGDQHFNNAVGALDNAIGVIEGLVQHTRDSLQETNRERLKIRDELTAIGEELETIHQKLGGKVDEEVAKLEETREKLRLRQRELIAEQARIEQKLEELNTRREELREEIQRITDSEADAQRAQRRLDAVEESVKVLERILKQETEELRPLLNDEINSHFKKIIDRAYWAELSEDFVLSIRKNVMLESGDEGPTTDVAQSTGQRQITSLVFIASLVALARQRGKIPTILRGLSGAEYPMVMDSPFGQLSTRFRSGVARWIPNLAPQVIILVSHTQFEGPVADELKKSKKVGKRYYLAYHGRELPKAAEQELQINKARVQVYFEAKEEHTQICELDA